MSFLGEANTSGFSDLDANAVTFTGEGSVRTGHQLLGFTYSNKEFISLDQRLGAFLETGYVAKRKGSWAFFKPTAYDRAQTMTPARDSLAAKVLRYAELAEWCRPSTPLKRHRTLVTGVPAERRQRTS